MSTPVLISFAGVLVAAVATGMLAGRCVRQPRIYFVVWTVAVLGLTIALAAQSLGFASGFGPVTFRAVQLSALLLVPLWLAWGLVELVVGSEAARFGMRLVSVALTVVAAVILATDPLTTQPFSKAWPLTGPHSQPVSQYALDVTQAVAVGAGGGGGRGGQGGFCRGGGQERSALAVGANGGSPHRSRRAHDGRAAPLAPRRDRLSAAQPAGSSTRLVRGQQGLGAARAGGRA